MSAVEIEAWVKKSGFRATGKYLGTAPPTKEDIKKLCRGEMAEILSHLARTVRSVDTVRHIRDNVKVQDAIGGADVKKQLKILQAEKIRKMAHLTQLQGNVKSVSSEIETLSTDIQAQVEDIAKNEERLACNGRRNILYRAYHSKIERKTQKIREYNRKLQQSLRSSLCSTSALDGSPSMDKSPLIVKDNRRREMLTEDDNDFVLTRQEDQMVMEDCEDYTRRLCEANAPSGSSEVFGPGITGREHKTIAASKFTTPSSKQKTTKFVSPVPKSISTLSPKQFIEALTKATEAKTKGLRRSTAAVNLKREAQDLKLNLEQTGSKATVSKENVESEKTLLTIQDIIADKRQGHINRFLEAEEAKNKASQIFSEIVAHFPEQQTRLCKAKVDNSGLKAQTQFLKEQIADLVAEKRFLADKEILANSIHERIEHFSTMRKEYFDQIRQFIQATGQMDCELQNTKKKIKEFFSCEFSSHLEDVIVKSESLKEVHSKEIETVDPIKLDDNADRLLNWKSEQLAPLAAAGCHSARFERMPPPLASLFRQIGFKTWSAPSNLLPHVTCMSENYVAEKQVENMLTAQLEQLEDELQDYPQKLARKLHKSAARAPARYAEFARELKETNNDLNKLLSERVPGTKRNLSLWWRQPAQYLVPWKTVDGKTLEEWLAQMSAANAQLQEVLRSRGASK